MLFWLILGSSEYRLRRTVRHSVSSSEKKPLLPLSFRVADQVEHTFSSKNDDIKRVGSGLRPTEVPCSRPVRV